MVSFILKGDGRFDRFLSPTWGELRCEQIPSLIADLYGRQGWELMVGTDSHTRDGTVIFASAFVVYRKGMGGSYFYSVLRERSKNYNFYSRIYREVELSIKLAKLLKEIFNPPFIEVHIDAGQDGLTSRLLPGLTGYVIGEGFKPVVKPYAFVASKLADRHSKH